MSHAAVLRLAALYNAAFGLFTLVLPFAWFDWSGMERPAQPWLWQCIGMIVGVYGVGYWCAAADPLRHWPITLVGLLGKVLGPLGFAAAIARGEIPWQAGWLILTNDLVWWWPFARILAAAREAARRERLA